MTNMKDYYKILDLPEYSDFATIKSAYRKLARKWHPDIAGNTSDVISKFKEINEAYDVLSNPAQKADYDRARKFYNYSSDNKPYSKTVKNSTKPNFNKDVKQENKFTNANNGQKTTKQNSFSFSWNDFIKKGFQECKNEKAEGAKVAKRGKDIYSDIEITFEDAINGTSKIINMLQTQVCEHCGGRKFVNGNQCLHCKGKGSVSTYKKFTVIVPAGIKNGSKIRLSGEGEKGVNGGQNGDMYLTVHIKSPLDYTVDGLNIQKTLNITPYEAVLGASISVSTPTGNVVVKISPNTQNGQKIRLSECGMKDGNKQGDMILSIVIQIPKNLSEQEIELYKKLKDLSQSTVR